MSFSIISEWKQQFVELLKLPELTVENGLISCLKYKNENNKLYRNIDIGPAYILYYKNGKIEYEEYWVNDKRHRPIEEGPAIVSYYENGQIEVEYYWIDDQKHRPTEEGPAIIYYYENGQIRQIIWC